MMDKTFMLLPEDFRFSRTSPNCHFRGEKMKKKMCLVRKNKKAKRRQQKASRKNRK